MKIGYVLKYFPKLSETFVLNEMVALERQGAEVSVMAFRPSGGAPMAPALAELGASVHYLDTKREEVLVRELAEHEDEVQRIVARRLPWLLEQVGREKTALKQLRRVAELALHVRAHGIDHLHAHFAGPAAELARVVGGLLGVPYSFTCHAKDIYHESVDPVAFRRLVHEAATVVTVCEANRRYILAELAPGSDEKVRVLYNGVDLRAFQPAAAEAGHSTEPLIVGVGRLVAKKGFVHLIEAAAHLEARGHRFRCLIAGEGRERAAIEARIHELGVRSVELLGATKHSEVAALLRGATVVTLPCIVDDEGNRDALPTVLLEAMASGVPVVSTPVTGVAEIIEEGQNGFLVPERDGEALADALETILADPERRIAMGRSARARAADRFDLDRNARELMSVLVAPRMREAVA